MTHAGCWTREQTLIVRPNHPYWSVLQPHLKHSRDMSTRTQSSIVPRQFGPGRVAASAPIVKRGLQEFDVGGQERLVISAVWPGTTVRVLQSVYSIVILRSQGCLRETSLGQDNWLSVGATWPRLRACVHTTHFPAQCNAIMGFVMSASSASCQLPGALLVARLYSEPN